MKLDKSLLFALAIALTAPAGIAGAAESPEASVQEKVVYHFNDMGPVRAGLRNIQNNLNASPDVKIVVVTHGKGIDFLLADAHDDKGPFQPAVAKLKEQGVTFDVCDNTLKSRGLDPMNVIKEAQIVPSGVAELVHLQVREHYAYVKP
jgi:intracellular sulfur oxidation DsrE/DsrF family protein